ncbi:copper transporter [Actinomyces sp. F1_1611]
MVNLRYHIVSLVAVFLALALGVVLGAGPLQRQINAASEGTNLAEKSSQLESQLATVQAEADQYATFVTDTAEQVLPGSLADRKIALILLPGANAEVAESVQATLREAGATVTGAAQLTDNWVSPGQREYRDTLANPVSSHLAASNQNGAADSILAQALVETLTGTGAEVDLLREILTDVDTPLVVANSMPEAPADQLVLITPSTPYPKAGQEEDSQSGSQPAASEQALTALAGALADGTEGAVAYGAAVTDDDVIALLRGQGTALATVDQIGTPMGNLNVALVLANQSRGAFGQGIGATTAVAPLK